INDLHISNDSEKLAVASKKGLYISTNRGLNWKYVYGGSSVNNIHIQDTDVFFSTGDGLYVIRDFTNGNIDAEQVVTLEKGTGKSITGDKDLLLFASYIPNKLYASTDGGEKWEIINEKSFSINLLDYT